jgi:uncharacterized protein YbaR (Trm112 family)
MIKKELLDVLACPKCKGDIKLEGKFLTCVKCKIAYPILGDVPDFLFEDAWTLDKAKRAKFKHNLKL